MVLCILYSSANRWLEQSWHVRVCVNLITVCHRAKCSTLELMLDNSGIHRRGGFQILQIREQREHGRAGGRRQIHIERQRW